MPRKKKQTQAQKEYRKEQQRIKRFIKRAQERGFMFDESVLPPTPKRITKASVQKLKKLTAKELYKRATYIDVWSGSLVSGTQGRMYERSKAAQQAAITRQRNRDLREQRQVHQEIEEYRERQREKQIAADSDTNYLDDYEDVTPSAEFDDGLDLEWKAPTTSTRTPPSVSVIGQIRSKIRELPAYKWVRKGVQFPIEPHKSMLESLLDDRVTLAEDEGYLDEFINYLNANEARLIEALNIVIDGSDQTNIRNSLTEAATILKAGALSPTESKDLESLLEYYNNYELPT